VQVAAAQDKDLELLPIIAATYCEARGARAEAGKLQVTFSWAPAAAAPVNINAVVARAVAAAITAVAQPPSTTPWKGRVSKTLAKKGPAKTRAAKAA
jgi:hypothetical protein